MTRFLAACLACLLAATAAAQAIYRWTDETGKTHIGTHPPAGAKARQLSDGIGASSAPAEIRRVPAAAAATPVVMYATSWCPHCARARAYFARKGIAYREYDIESSPSAHAEFRRLGGRGVPLIVHGGQTMSGFSERSFEALLARSKR